MTIFIVAEIGINHNGEMSICKELIDVAAEAGCDAVKFQKRAVEKVYTKELLDSPRKSPWRKTQTQQKNGLEFGKKDYDFINNFCKEKKILWSASAWDIDSQYFLRNYSLKFNKVASAMLGNKPLLREIASEGIKTFISTGMSTIEEIDEAVNIFKQKNCKFELMHCNSSYPMNEKEANLKCIPMLRKRYSCDVGYSGHESSLLKVSIVAVTLGATSLERHITLDRAMYGSDQAASISASTLKAFVESVRAVNSILGDGKKIITEAEKSVRKKLRVNEN